MRKVNGPAPLVLIVDDHADTREMYAMYLAHHGFRYVLAGDGATAIRAALGAQPDVIVMDLSLPQIDGLEAEAEQPHGLHPHHRLDRARRGQQRCGRNRGRV